MYGKPCILKREGVRQILHMEGFGVWRGIGKRQTLHGREGCTSIMCTGRSNRAWKGKKYVSASTSDAPAPCSFIVGDSFNFKKLATLEHRADIISRS